MRVLAVLMDQGLVSLNRVAQDGMRVRASAGGSSFRRQARWEEPLRDAQAQVEALKNQIDEDSGAADRRVQAAKARAVTERRERVAEALAQLPELEAKRERRQKGDGAKARCSTTDPDARRRKRADGGTRPAYNVPLATTDETRLIVGGDATNVGSDSGLMTPLVEQLERHFDRRPQESLTDGGYSSKHDLEELQSHGTTVYTPIRDEENKRLKGQGPFAPLPGDSPLIAAWRQRRGNGGHPNNRQTAAQLGGVPECGLPQPRPETVLGAWSEQSESGDPVAGAGLPLHPHPLPRLVARPVIPPTWVRPSGGPKRNRRHPRRPMPPTPTGHRNPTPHPNENLGSRKLSNSAASHRPEFKNNHRLSANASRRSSLKRRPKRL